MTAPPKAPTSTAASSRASTTTSCSAEAAAGMPPAASSQPVAFAAHEDELDAALQDGRVVQSADGGKTWNVRAAL